TSGSVGPALKQLAELLARRLEIRRKIAAALVYPLILLGMSIVAIAVIVAFLLPSIAPVFADANLPMPGILGALLDLQENFLRIAVMAACAAALAYVGWRTARTNAAIIAAVDKLKTALPLAGKMIQLREA